MVVQEQPKTFRLHCGECPNNTGYFETARDNVVHLDKAGKSIVFYATCPNGHQHPVEPEFAMFAPEVRQAVESLRNQIDPAPTTP